MMREAKIDTIVQVLTVPVHLYLTVPVQMDHVIKTADESITSPKFT